jgi:8-oxo-dGTP pyrophosphatase MutT (NUDIX family)
VSDDSLDVPHARAGNAQQQPRDAATLILLRRRAAGIEVLLGERHPDHKFMPGKFVFPGGRLDRCDSRVPVASEMSPETVRRLLLRMRGKPSLTRARALALAAIRETFEEAGLIVGEPFVAPASVPAGWRAFFATGHAPALAGLRFFARAITPPGRVRRFDTRFFLADARAIANQDRPLPTPANELRGLAWFPLHDALALNLASITRDILERLIIAGADNLGGDALSPVSFQFMRSGRWEREWLP